MTTLETALLPLVDDPALKTMLFRRMAPAPPDSSRAARQLLHAAPITDDMVDIGLAHQGRHLSAVIAAVTDPNLLSSILTVLVHDHPPAALIQQALTIVRSPAFTTDHAVILFHTMMNHLNWGDTQQTPLRTYFPVESIIAAVPAHELVAAATARTTPTDSYIFLDALLNAIINEPVDTLTGVMVDGPLPIAQQLFIKIAGAKDHPHRVELIDSALRSDRGITLLRGLLTQTRVFIDELIADHIAAAGPGLWDGTATGPTTSPTVAAEPAALNMLSEQRYSHQHWLIPTAAAYRTVAAAYPFPPLSLLQRTLNNELPPEIVTGMAAALIRSDPNSDEWGAVADVFVVRHNHHISTAQLVDLVRMVPPAGRVPHINTFLHSLSGLSRTEPFPADAVATVAAASIEQFTFWIQESLPPFLPVTEPAVIAAVHQLSRTENLARPELSNHVAVALESPWAATVLDHVGPAVFALAARHETAARWVTEKLLATIGNDPHRWETVLTVAASDTVTLDDAVAVATAITAEPSRR